MPKRHALLAERSKQGWVTVADSMYGGDTTSVLTTSEEGMVLDTQLKIAEFGKFSRRAYSAIKVDFSRDISLELFGGLEFCGSLQVLPSTAAEGKKEGEENEKRTEQIRLNEDEVICAATLRTTSLTVEDSYQAILPLRDVEQKVQIPFSSFMLTRRGRVMVDQPNLNTANITGMGITLSSPIDVDLRLTLTSVEAVSEQIIEEGRREERKEGMGEERRSSTEKDGNRSSAGHSFPSF